MYSPLDFIACNLYRKDCADQNTIGVLWGTMKDDLREEYLARARGLINEWKAEEGRAAEAREAGNARAAREAGNARAFFAPNPT